jgi:chaperonin GroES
MALKPLNDRIVVTPAEAETRTASGLVLPDSAQEKPQRGQVLAVGPGKRLDNGTLVRPDVSVGDTVLYGKYSGTEVKLQGHEYVILRADDVLGIIEGGVSRKAIPSSKSPQKGKSVKTTSRAGSAKTSSKSAKAATKPGAKAAQSKPAAKRKK